LGTTLVHHAEERTTSIKLKGATDLRAPYRQQVNPVIEFFWRKANQD
jgi:hypothetical protein